MSDREHKSTTLSRRDILAATALPALAETSAPERPSVAAQCAAWLATNAKIERLTLRWATLDACAIGQSGNGQSSPSGRRPAGLVDEMAKIEKQLAPLDQSRESGLEVLAKRPALTLQDVASKLTVAACMLDGEGGPVHDIVAEAASVLSARAT